MTKRNTNNVTMDIFTHSPFMNNTQTKIANFPNERRISSDILAETIKEFKGLKIQSTMNDSSCYHSYQNDAKSNPKSDDIRLDAR